MSVETHHKGPVIGSIELPTPVLLAPMAGYTDLAFRSMVRSLGGLGLAYSEMLNPRSFLIGRAKNAKHLLQTNASDVPLAYQIYGHEPEVLADGAKWLVEYYGARVIDINMGCPQKKIARRGAGAGLLRTPGKAIDIARKVVATAGVPVTVKIRILPADAGISTMELVREFEQAGVAAITVHARTCVQKFSGCADWPAIRAVVEVVNRIPVFGNGDVCSPEDAVRMINETGCKAIMVGRQAIKDPWLPRQIASALGYLPPLQRVSRAERVSFMLMHLQRMEEQYGEKSATLLFRRWIPQYSKTLPIPRLQMIELLRIADPETMMMELQKV